MWFKQIQYFHLKAGIPYQADYLTQALEGLVFEPCLPSLPVGMGFIPPMDLIRCTARTCRKRLSDGMFTSGRKNSTFNRGASSFARAHQNYRAHPRP